jgi:hypothetical protein
MRAPAANTHTPPRCSYRVGAAAAAQNAQPMPRAGHAYILQHLIVDLAEQIDIDVVSLEGVRILSESDPIEPSAYLAHDASCSNSALASFRSSVSKLSVNQP